MSRLNQIFRKCRIRTRVADDRTTDSSRIAATAGV
jgi:hypothetical protein